MLPPDQLEAYLRRIDYRGPREATAETLRRLHLAHLHAVPFENLDIHRNVPIVLSDDRNYEKIVTNRRGGFCYELNGAFACLLETLGFRVDRISAGVFGPKGFGPEFDHLALIVHLDERWLADVGFGHGFLEPLRLDRENAGSFRLTFDPPYYVLEEAGSPQYRFTDQTHTLDEYIPRCQYHQTSPDSSFTQKRVCTLATRDGRITLTGDQLIVTSHGNREERPVESDDAWHEALRAHFQIQLS